MSKRLISPDILDDSGQQAISIESLLLDGGSRYEYFLTKVSQAWIWQDHDQALFEKLKIIAQEQMDAISNLCELRFQVLQQERKGSELVAYHWPRKSTLDAIAGVVHEAAQPCSHTNGDMQKSDMTSISVVLDEPSPPSNEVSAGPIHRQDHVEVRAVVVYDEARQEAGLSDTAQIELFQLPRSPLLLDEEVFISQLRRRAKVLNDGFQQKVADVVLGHSSRTDSRVFVRSDHFSPHAAMSAHLRGASSLKNILDFRRKFMEAYASSVESVVTTAEQSAGFQQEGEKSQHYQRVMCSFEEGESFVEIHHAPIKTIARMREKLVEYYARGAQWPLSANILDPVRASVVGHGASQVLQIVRWFLDDDGAAAALPICRVKNKFAFSREALVGGYRDVMICVLYEGEHGLRIIGEIQVQDKALHDLKIKMHKLYKLKRARSANAI